MDSQTPSTDGHSLEDLERAVDLLSPGSQHDEVLLVLDAAVIVKQRACALHERCLALALIWVKEHGPLVCGEVRWEARRAKKVACRDLVATVQAILEHVGGDLAGLTAHLQAQPFKHGSCQRTLEGEVFTRLFLTSFDDHLKLVRIDERFLPRIPSAKEVRRG